MAVSKPPSSHERSPRRQPSGERSRPGIDSHSSPAAASNGSPASRLPSGRLAVAAAVFVVWAAGLISLAIVTSNPVTLNRAQIIAAAVVVEAVSDAEAPVPEGWQHWRVLRSWPANQTGDLLEIEGLDGLPLEAGQSYLIPLVPVLQKRSKNRNRWRVVLTPQPFAAPLVYPADSHTVAELEGILQDAGAE